MNVICRRPIFWLFCAIIVFLLNQFPFIEDMRPVMYDEAWYSNPAYNFAIGNGFINSIVGSGGNANFLFPFIVSIFLHIVGFNLFAVRLAAMFCGLLTICFLFLVLKQMKLEWRPVALTMLVFVTLPIFNTAFRFGRPECASLMFMTSGILFYLRYLKLPSWGNILGLSVSVFLAGCSHPFSLLFFTLVGLTLFVQDIKKKEYKRFAHLVVLFIFGIVTLAATAYVSIKYNAGTAFNERFSSSGVAEALPVYLKHLFLSNTAISILPILLVCVLALKSQAKLRLLTFIALIHLILFPFFFSTDLVMVTLGLDYFILIGLFVFAALAEQYANKKQFYVFVIVFCIGNYGLSQYYNYVVKYENVNSSLTETLHNIIPQGSKVFGPIRQWPMIMNTDYTSDHARYDVGNALDYEYIITNSPDEENYPNYKYIFPLPNGCFNLIYETKTRQYGTVQVFKRKVIRDDRH